MGSKCYCKYLTNILEKIPTEKKKAFLLFTFSCLREVVLWSVATSDWWLTCLSRPAEYSAFKHQPNNDYYCFDNNEHQQTSTADDVQVRAVSMEPLKAGWCWAERHGASHCSLMSRCLCGDGSFHARWRPSAQVTSVCFEQEKESPWPSWRQHNPRASISTHVWWALC